MFNIHIKKTKGKVTTPLLKILALSLIVAILVSFFLQYSQGVGGIPNSLLWIIRRFLSFALSSIFILFIILLMFSIIGNYYVSTLICLAVFGAMGYANMKKLHLLGEPIYPVDFYQVRYISSLYSMIGGTISSSTIVIFIVVLILLAFVISLLPKLKVNIVSRAILLAISLPVIYSFFNFNSSLLQKAVNKSGVSVVLWNQPLNYELNGFVFGLLSNLQNTVMYQPEDYNEAAIKQIVEKYKNEAEIKNSEKIASNQTETKNIDKPNIIFVMNETFWDPTRFESVTYSEDPMKNIRNLMNTTTSGWLLSPEFGGNTANVEFEALTGLSMYNFLPGSIPYQQSMDKDGLFPSIISLIEGYNYKTVAIHPYNKTFYKRNRVYNYLGFDEFIGEGEMKFNNRLSEGAYISDQAVVDEILYKIKETDTPLFIHTVTMQNHAPYTLGKNGDNSITVTATGLSETSTKDLETYAEGIKQTDIAIKNLTDSLSELDEPTMVVFWGDHLPGINSTIYEETGFSKDNVFQSQRTISETPLFIYSNFDLPQRDLKSMSPSFLGVTLFDMLEMPYTPYYAMLEKIKEALPGLKLNVLIDSEGNLKDDISIEEELVLNEYKLIQYDLILGNKYSLTENFY